MFLAFQQICDGDLKILSVYARYGGSAHDSFVWNNCYIKQLLLSEYTSGERNTFLLGKKIKKNYVKKSNNILYFFPKVIVGMANNRGYTHLLLPLSQRHKSSTTRSTKKFEALLSGALAF